MLSCGGLVGSVFECICCLLVGVLFRFSVFLGEHLGELLYGMHFFGKKAQNTT